MWLVGAPQHAGVGENPSHGKYDVKYVLSKHHQNKIFKKSAKTGVVCSYYDVRYFLARGRPFGTTSVAVYGVSFHLSTTDVDIPLPVTVARSVTECHGLSSWLPSSSMSSRRVGSRDWSATLSAICDGDHVLMTQQVHAIGVFVCLFYQITIQ